MAEKETISSDDVKLTLGKISENLKDFYTRYTEQNQYLSVINEKLNLMFKQNKTEGTASSKLVLEKLDGIAKGLSSEDKDKDKKDSTNEKMKKIDENIEKQLSFFKK